ncbi:hypothetical protein BKA61DRAFT_254331 [Leptodontidium sp. MPI-SDFR-AT-0119]|nr:hypothetical protein BKA61DRAFT_254331 [Leptodontidium sp. MPI-SDFR-AT-0119]
MVVHVSIANTAKLDGRRFETLVENLHQRRRARARVRTRTRVKARAETRMLKIPILPIRHRQKPMPKVKLKINSSMRRDCARLRIPALQTMHRRLPILPILWIRTYRMQSYQATFPTILDFSMGEFDWSAPESAEALTTFEVGCDIGSQTFVDNLMAITSSPDSLESMGQLSANPTYFAAVAQTEKLFSPPATASLAAKTMPHELQLSSPKELVNKSSQSPNTTPSRACDLSLYCQSPSRCTLQCHAILNMHLSDLSAMRAKEPRATLDVLLDLDGRIGQARDKVLSCPICLASPACAQTIMLISIVVENLLALFESSCASPDADELESGQQQHDSGYGRLDAGLTDASLDSESSKCWMRTRHSLPYTKGQLTVGTIHIDESVKVGFSRWLIRLYLERQIAVVKELNLLLAREISARENVIFKVTVELLLDIERRLEYFVGFIMMIAGPG